MVVAVLVISALSLVGITLWTDWDIKLADRAFDINAGVFPMRHVWLTETFNHVILKSAFITLALVIVLRVVWDIARPGTWTWLRRFQLRVIALSAVLIPTAISLIKQASDSHCPWDLQRYGGTEPYVRLFEYLPAGISPGHCMPGGHASSALWMISLSVLFVPNRMLHATVVFAASLTFGISVGWLQQLRGAHVLTHTLWSAWIALLIVLIITTCLDRWPRRKLMTHDRSNGKTALN
jgi:membrane-associated PAP2 superfamily phosphatase